MNTCTCLTEALENDGLPDPRAVPAACTLQRHYRGDYRQLGNRRRARVGRMAVHRVVAGVRPLGIDLFCGLGGFTEGLLAEGYNVVGFDNERHVYGEHRYPAQLVLQDVLTLHGRQFKDAALIVASPPCQAYSYRAMPWKRAKALPPPDNTLFEACFRIQREAIETAGHFIPLVVENVCGAQKWVGRARWNCGSMFLWGDVPALMPKIRHVKVGGLDWNRYRKGTPGYGGEAFNGQRGKSKAESAALIAKIPFELAQWIARAWKPEAVAA